MRETMFVARAIEPEPWLVSTLSCLKQPWLPRSFNLSRNDPVHESVGGKTTCAAVVLLCCCVAATGLARQIKLHLLFSNYYDDFKKYDTPGNVERYFDRESMFTRF